MFRAINKEGKGIYIDDATKNETYFCPICGSEMIVKKGEYNAHHFAHKTKTLCDSWTYDMSPWHKGWQERFPKEYREVVVSHKGEKHRADILIKNTVIEFQHSPMSEKEFNERNHFYTSAGNNVIWLFDMIDEWDQEKMKYTGFYSNVLSWSNPKKTFLNFEPHKEPKIKLYFQTVDNSLQKWDCGIIPVTWKPSDSMDRFKTKTNDCLTEEEFMELFIPKPQTDKEFSVDDLYDVKYETRTKTNDGCYLDCPIKKGMHYLNCNCCEFQRDYPGPHIHSLYPIACTHRFKDIAIHKDDKISALTKDSNGFITKITVIDANNNLKTIQCPDTPTSTAFSLVQLWNELQPLVMICVNIKDGNSVKISKSPAETLKKYGKIYGYFKRYDWDDFSKDSREIYSGEKQEWLCAWYLSK